MFAPAKTGIKLVSCEVHLECDLRIKKQSDIFFKKKTLKSIVRLKKGVIFAPANGGNDVSSRETSS